MENDNGEDETVKDLRMRDGWCRQREDLMGGIEGCQEMGQLVQGMPWVVNDESVLIASDGGVMKKRPPKIAISTDVRSMDNDALEYGQWDIISNWKENAQRCRECRIFEY